MNEFRVEVRKDCLQGKSCTFRATLLDASDLPIPASAVTAMTLTLLTRLVSPPTVVNSVNRVNILNAGRGTLGATDGKVTVNLTPADNAILSELNAREPRTALVEWTYNGPSGAGADKGGTYMLYNVVNGDFIP